MAKEKAKKVVKPSGKKASVRAKLKDLNSKEKVSGGATSLPDDGTMNRCRIRTGGRQ